MEVVIAPQLFRELRLDLLTLTGRHVMGHTDTVVSDIAIFVLKRDVKLQLTN